MKWPTFCLMIVVLLLATLPALAQTPVTVPLGSVTLPPPPPVAFAPVSVTLTVTVNGVPMQTNLTLAGTVAPVTGSTTQFQLTLNPVTTPLVLTPTTTHTELPDAQPWLFLSGFQPLADGDTPDQVKAGNRIMLVGHDFGEQNDQCRVLINNTVAPILSWLDSAIVVQTPAYPQPAFPAEVLVWRSPDDYDNSLASFTLAPAG